MPPVWSWREDAYLSPWSIMYFLTGYLWNLVWTWAFDATLPVLNLAILVVVACIFEVLENQDGNTFWIWRFCGYEEEGYTGDTALNSAMDVLLSPSWAGGRCRESPPSPARPWRWAC